MSSAGDLLNNAAEVKGTAVIPDTSQFLIMYSVAGKIWTLNCCLNEKVNFATCVAVFIFSVGRDRCYVLLEVL